MSRTNSSINKQSGFGLIEVSLIVVVVGVLGATAWYAFSSKNKTDKILSQAGATNQNSSQSLKSQNLGGIKYNVAVPADFKQQLQADFTSFKPTCSVVGSFPAQFTVLKNINNQFIQVAQDCGNQGGKVIYAQQAGKWTQAAISSGTYACSDVDQYKISKQLAATCYVTNLDGSQTIRVNTNP